MKDSFLASLYIGLGVLALAVLAGCESTGDNDGGGAYYGAGFYDPWYVGGYWYDDVDVVVTPPDWPERPEAPVKPEHPIAKPPISPQPAPHPMPSIPRTPMPRVRLR